MALEHLDENEYEALKSRGLVALNDEAYDRYKLPKGYGIPKPVAEEAPKEKGLIEKGMDVVGKGLKKAGELGTSFNEGVDAIADTDKNDKAGDSYQPHDPADAAIILGAKGLRAVGEAGKVAGEQLDGVADSMKKGLGPTADFATSAVLGPLSPTNQVEMLSGMMPRTSMQAAFALLTSVTELKAAGRGIISAGKKFGGKAAAYARETPLGSFRSPAELYPESKLAKRLESFFGGSEGEGRFNIINQSIENTELRKIKGKEIGTAESALGNKQEGHIFEREAHDLENTIKSTDGKLTKIGLQRETDAKQFAVEIKELEKKLGTIDASLVDEKAGIAKQISDKKQELLNLKEQQGEAQDSARWLAETARGQKLAIQADLSVDKALQMAAVSRRGIHVGRGLDSARGQAAQQVDLVYDFANSASEPIGVGVESLKVRLGEQYAGLTSKLLEIVPEDKRASKLLTTIGAQLEETATLDTKAAIANTEKLATVSKSAAEARNELMAKKEVTLKDLFEAYKDLNGLHREKGDKIYGQARDAILLSIREAERGANLLAGHTDSVKDAKFAVRLWDSARQARMSLDAAFEHETLKKLLDTAKSSEPHKVFDQLLGKESGMTLERFMAVAPKEAQLVVRRESMRTGLDAVVGAKKGEAVAALDKWVKAVGSGNMILLHAGADEVALRGIASAQDSMTGLSKSYPAIGKEVNSTMDAIIALAEKEGQAVKTAETLKLKTKEAISGVQDSDVKNAIKAGQDTAKAKQAGWNKEGVIKERARKDALANREHTTKRIADGITAIEKAFQVRARLSGRAGEAGKWVVDMERKDDVVGTGAIVGGLGAMAMAKAAELAGVPVSKYVYGGAALSVALGIAKKAPRFMSNVYYTPKGRALMESIASAPNATEAAKGLLELAIAIKGPAAYLASKQLIKDKLPEKQEQQKPQGPNLGKLSGLRTPIRPSDKVLPVSDSQPNDVTNPWNHGDAALENLPDETYVNPVE